jgi:transposase
MREKKNRIYPEEFKLEALQLLETSKKSVRQIERELGITAGLLWKWRNRYEIKNPLDGKKEHLELSDLEVAKREIRRLEREIVEIAEEREILKKVVNIFSRTGA